MCFLRTRNEIINDINRYFDVQLPSFTNEASMVRGFLDIGVHNFYIHCRQHGKNENSICKNLDSQLCLA